MEILVKIQERSLSTLQILNLTFYRKFYLECFLYIFNFIEYQKNIISQKKKLLENNLISRKLIYPSWKD